MSDAAVDLSELFDYLWGTEDGWVYFPIKLPLVPGAEKPEFERAMFHWPAQKRGVVNYVLKNATHPGDLYFAPALFNRANPHREHVQSSRVLWVDFDGNAPVDWPTDVAPEPNLIIRSSLERNQHCYWFLDEIITDRDVLEDRNRALALALHADTSGWDANQILRPPHTINRKRNLPVEIVHWDEGSYTLADFGHLTSPQQVVSNTILDGDIPTIDEVSKLARWDSIQLKVFGRTPEDFAEGGKDRSRSLANLAHHGAELGWTDEQIYAVLEDADTRWEKYATRHNREQILLDLINQARQKHGYDEPKDFDAFVNRILYLTPVTVDEDDKAERLGIVSIDEINSFERDTEWLVDGLLDAQGLALLTGRQGTGKTQLALQLAAALATGKERFLNWDLPTNGAKKVLFLSLEMATPTLKRFTAPLRECFPEPDLAKNLYVLPAGESLPLNREEGQAYFTRVCERYQPDLVIVDSLESVSERELTDETSAKEIMNFFLAAKQRHKMAVVLIHHHRKRSNEFASQKRGNSLYDVYGSNYITTKVDLVLDVDLWRNDKGEQLEKNRLTIVDLKNRLAEMMHHPIEVKRDHKLHFTLYDEEIANRIAGEMIDGYDDPSGFGF